jgi:hypothetical protein
VARHIATMSTRDGTVCRARADRARIVGGASARGYPRSAGPTPLVGAHIGRAVEAEVTRAQVYEQLTTGAHVTPGRPRPGELARSSTWEDLRLGLLPQSTFPPSVFAKLVDVSPIEWSSGVMHQAEPDLSVPHVPVPSFCTA